MVVIFVITAFFTFCGGVTTFHFLFMYPKCVPLAHFQILSVPPIITIFEVFQPSSNISFFFFTHVPLFFCLPAAIVPSQLGKKIYFCVRGLFFFAYLDRRARRPRQSIHTDKPKKGKKENKKDNRPLRSPH